MTTLSDILAAAQIGETTDWEFKSARGGFPGSLWACHGDSVGEPGDSLHKAGDSLRKSPDSLHRAGDSLHKDASEADLLRQLAAAVRDSRRCSTAVVRDAIVALCTGRFLTVRQLAELLGRNDEHLRGRYLAPMVREGLLRPKYPTATNRPDQAYTAAGEQ